MKGSTASSTIRTGPTAGRAPSRCVDRFRLTGASGTFDPRTTAARRDIADIALADRLFAPHYVRPVKRICGDVAAMLHAGPEPDAPAVSQLLPGEGFAVLDPGDVRSWGYAMTDGYVGYVATAALTAAGPAPTHVVAVPTTLMFAHADIKAPAPVPLPIGSQVAGRIDGAFLALAGGGHVPAQHVRPVDGFAVDPVAVACLLVGTPYLWGGRGGGGIDCSGLVQLALARCGIAVPRDSDQQAATIGVPLPADVRPTRGDIVFLPGHVGMMVDSDHVVHANAHWMAVVIEPLAAVVARFATDRPDAIPAWRRLAAGPSA